MEEPTGWLCVAPSNAAVFTDARDADMLLYTSTPEQRVLVGVGDNTSSVLAISGSNVGVGTSSPAMRLDVGGNTVVRGDVYTQGLILSSAGAPQLMVDDGGLTGEGSRSAAFFDNDGTVIALPVDHNSNASLRIVSGTDTELMRVTREGMVGIGTPHPRWQLDVAAGTPGEVAIGTDGQIVSLSDSRIKDDIRPIECALDRVALMRGYTYTRVGAPSGAQRSVGLIAQEVRTALPELVYEDNSTGMLSIAYSNTVALLVEAINELRSKLTHMTHLMAVQQQILDQRCPACSGDSVDPAGM